MDDLIPDQESLLATSKLIPKLMDAVLFNAPGEGGSEEETDLFMDDTEFLIVNTKKEEENNEKKEEDNEMRDEEQAPKEEEKPLKEKLPLKRLRGFDRFIINQLNTSIFEGSKKNILKLQKYEDDSEEEDNLQRKSNDNEPDK